MRRSRRPSRAGLVACVTLLAAGSGTAGCAANPAPFPSSARSGAGVLQPSAPPPPPGARDPGESEREFERLRSRTTWPSQDDHARWDRLVTRAASALDSGDSAALDSALFELRQLDDLFRVGEAARTRR